MFWCNFIVTLLCNSVRNFILYRKQNQAIVAQQNGKPTLKKNKSALASRSRNTALNAQLYRDQLVKIINVPEVISINLQRLFGLLVYSITKMYLFQEQTVLTVIDECIWGFLEDWKKQHEGHSTDKSILQFLIGKVYHRILKAKACVVDLSHFLIIACNMFSNYHNSLKVLKSYSRKEFQAECVD